MEPLNPDCQRLRPLAEYTRRLPSSQSGKRLNRATLWRWALAGLRDGRRLKTVALGGGRMTCDAWVWQFLVQADNPREARSLPSMGNLRDVDRIARRLG